jgi:hypothetical protein
MTVVIVTLDWLFTVGELLRLECMLLIEGL